MYNLTTRQLTHQTRTGPFGGKKHFRKKQIRGKGRLDIDRFIYLLLSKDGYLQASVFNVSHRSPTFGGWWNLMEADGVWWSLMDCVEAWWSVMECDGVWWSVMECDGVWRECMRVYESPWECMGVHGSAWECTTMHESAWEPMRIHISLGTHLSPGIHWGTMASLETSELQRKFKKPWFFIF